MRYVALMMSFISASEEHRENFLVCMASEQRRNKVNLILIIHMTSKSKTKKIVAGVLGLMLSLTLVAGVGAQTANAALSTSQVDEIISLLTSFGADAGTITHVRASLTGGTPTAPTAGGTTMGTGYTFTRNLKQGDTGEDVKQLQMVLNANGYGPTSGAGSSGNETTYFGAVTKAGVVKFQNK